MTDVVPAFFDNNSIKHSSYINYKLILGWEVVGCYLLKKEHMYDKLKKDIHDR